MTEQTYYAGNTIHDLQAALCKEIRKITEDMLFTDVKTGQQVRMDVYEQRLPTRKEDVETSTASDEDTIEYVSKARETVILQFPWCKVIALSGDIADIDADQIITMVLVFGIFDKEPENKGHLQAEVIIQRIINRFMKSHILEGQYQLDRPKTGDGKYITWEIETDQDTYPYTFAVMTLNFSVIQNKSEWGDEYL